MPRASTLQEDIDDSNSNGNNGNVSHTSSSSSFLASQAIKASPPPRRQPSLSFAFQDHDPQRSSKSFDASGGLRRDEAKSGFWGVLAHKAKSIVEDKNSSAHDIQHQNLKSTSFNTNTFTPTLASQFKTLYQSSDYNKKMDNPKLRKGLDAITSSLNQLGDTFEKAFEEGKTIVETKTADLRTQMRRKGNVPEAEEDSYQVRNPWQQTTAHTNTNTPSSHETQLKASRDVAMATAAKAKLLLRELKTVKADLAFAKARCTQLEEENKLLRDREGSGKGHNREDDDDMIRLQLETLVAEKARLANENEIYSRENRFLREIVEYHQLTMQDVVYLDEGMEEVTHVYPIDASSSSPPPSPNDEVQPIMAEEEDNKSTSEDEVPPSVQASFQAK
ncbi:hypothetical protein RIF29_00036 [Crotalaria pallida]|uniref:Uncharacterized protein n=1 Tax=Crotalaria pallida TaxID=3830 RepID=A0AAN9IVF2_CROPI